MHQAAAALEAAGLATTLRPTSAPGAARDLARAAVREGAQLVLACGGDGTINEVINGLLPGEATLGILPGGTANVFARELGIPLNPVRAARQLIRWTPRRIALGRAEWMNRTGAAERRYFLSLAGAGFDAYVIHRVSHRFARAFGIFAYASEAVRQVLRYPFPVFTCRAEGREIHATLAVVHRVERYAGWLHLAPGANVFDDRFTLCLFKSPRRWRYVLYTAAVAVRQHTRRLRDVELLQSRKVECTTADPHTPVYFELDGELAGQLPATFEIVPDALPVLVP